MVSVIRHLLILCLMAFIIPFPIILSGQSLDVSGYFRSPVNFPLLLSGTYGEVRINHFHSGIDIRTGGVTGKPVYAAADGYVSRIYVSPWGFGKAIYINHQAGYTTVYGHLDRFAPKIAPYARDEQYSKESFAIDMMAPFRLIPVKQGELIGYSGNSGSSGGPHLHFEIRELTTQDPLDPQDLGIKAQDHIPPQIQGIKIYPKDAQSLINYSNQPIMLQAAIKGREYVVLSKDTVMLSGNIIFGIDAYDYHDSSSMKNGIKSIELWVDGMKVFGQRIGRFPFSDTRYSNSLLDYPQFRKNGQRIIRSYVVPGNKLKVFEGVQNRGMLTFTDRRTHRLQYVVKDVQGNESRLIFYVKSHPPAPGGIRPDESPSPENHFSWNEANRFENDDILFDMPAGALYEDIDFTYSKTPAIDGTITPLHILHNTDIPVHTFCELSIRADQLPEFLQSKALVVRVEKDKKFVSAGGRMEEGYMTTRIREFGAYAVAVDTVAPVVKSMNIFPGKNISKQSTIVFKISDDLSGINSYRGTLNDKWILMEYDPKESSLTYRFDDRISTGRNQFHLMVTDGVGNETEYSAELIR